jgi:predicted nucleic acid-binding protein
MINEAIDEKVVVDANIALKWVLTEADSQVAQALLAEWKKKKLAVFVPALLPYEVTNILYREVRAGRITFDIARDGINLILRTVSLDFSRDSALNFRAMALANRFDLPATYDAHYLALAELKDCPLWTADTRMWRAVKDQLDWVHWIGEYTVS